MFARCNSLLVKQNVGLLAEHLIKHGFSHVIVVAIVPFPVKAFAEAVVVARTATATLMHNYSIEVEQFAVPTLVLGVDI